MNLDTFFLLAGGYFAISLVISVAIGFSAHRNRVPTQGNEYNINTGALIWALGCLVVPFFVAPAFLVRLRRVRAIRSRPPEVVQPLPPGTRITCSFTMDLEQALRAERAAWSKIANRETRRTAFVSWSLLLLGAISAGVFWRFHWSEVVVGLVAIAYLVGWPIYRKAEVKATLRSCRHQVTHPSWTITPTFLEVDNPEVGTSRLNWSIFVHAHIVADGALLYVSRSSASWFPKTGFDDEAQFQQFLRLLVEHELPQTRD